MSLLSLKRFSIVLSLLLSLISLNHVQAIDFANLDFASAANNMCPDNPPGDRNTVAPADNNDFDFGETARWQNVGLINGVCIDVEVSLVTNVNNQEIGTVGNAIQFRKFVTGAVVVRYDFFVANTSTNELIYPQFMLGDIDLDRAESITFPEIQIGSYITGENPPDGSGLGTQITVTDLGVNYQFSNSVSSPNPVEPRNSIIVEFTPIGYFEPSYYSNNASERWFDVTGNIDPDVFFGNWTRVPVDVTPPSVPTVTSQTTDNITPVIAGTADAYTEVTVVVGGATYILQPFEVPSGTWSINTRTRSPDSGAFNPNTSGTPNEVVVTSTDPGNNSTSDATNNELTINAAPASKVVFTQEPTNATAGVDFSPVITAEIRDVYDHVLNTGATVTLAIASGTGSLDGTTSVTAVNGIATFTGIDIDEAGNFTLRVTSAGLTQATSSSFTISPAAASAVNFVQEPGNRNANQNFSPNITAEIVDAFGNRVNSTANIVLSIATGTGALDGTLTRAAVAGLATFTAINIDEAGVFTLGVTSGVLTQDTSASFTISAGAPVATNSLFTTTANNAVANGSATNTVLVTVRDAYNNVVPSTAVTVALSNNGSATVGAIAGSTNASGQISINLTSTTAEALTLGLSVNAAASGKTTAATFVPGAAVATNALFTTTANNALANGSATNTVLVTVRDANNNIIPSTAVTVALTNTGSATVGAIAGSTNASGQISINLTSTTAEALTLGLSVNAAASGKTTGATFVPGAAVATNSLFTTTTNNAEADGSSTNTVLVTVRDANNNVIPSTAVTVALTNTGSATVGTIAGSTNASGQISINLTDSTVENLTVGLTVNAAASGKTTSVSFTVGAPVATNALFTTTANNAVANGSATNTVLVTVRDANNNIVPSTAVTVALTNTGSATVGAIAGSTNASGQISINLTSTTAEALTLGLSVNAAASGKTTGATFVPGVAVATNALFTTTTNNALANGSATNTVLVTVRDANNNIIPSTAVTVALTNTGSATVGAIAGSTNASGQISINLTSTTAEALTLGLSVNAAASGKTTGATFVAGAPLASASIITTSVNNAEADGLDVNTVIVEIRDQYNNPVPNTTVTVLLDDTGNATVGAIAASTDANGQISINLTNAVAEDLTVGFILGVVTATDTTDLTFLPGPTTDSDTDGVLDLIEIGEGTNPHDDESFRDTDSDDTPDALEPDSDNDGLTDTYESAGTDPYGDNDADGIPNYLDKDDKGDGSTAACTDVAPTNGICDSGNALDPTFDADQDGNPNHIESDSDNDGVSDIVEYAEGTDPYDDEDFKDSDGDDTPDALETDADKDGLPNDDESGGINPYGDNDGDGVPNYLDKDDKGDGTAAACTDTTPVDAICDAGEALDPEFDADQDGEANHTELDSDDDGADDSVENAEGTDPYDDEDFKDTDGDGTPDAAEDDSDNDGIDNDDESDGTDPYGDNDGDGIPNYLDKDDKGDGTPAACADTSPVDGICDLGEALDPEFDTDQDGEPNHADEDSDNDGAPDSVELAEGTDPYDDEDFKDTDGDGTPDSEEPDSDNDGDSNSSETGGNDPYGDNDDDGIPDYLDKDDKGDGTPSSCTDTTPADGICDAGEALDPTFDLDGDGIPNHIDEDTDGDEVPDSVEKAEGSDHQDEDDFIDTDGDDVPDALEDDSDEDGIDDEDESEGNEPYGDNDDDGIPNYLDKDDKGDGNPAVCTDTSPVDGVCDLGQPLDPSFDADQDGKPNHTEEDSDDDGVPDSVENAEGTNPYDDEDFKDTDGDGIPDAVEPDADNDGIPNDDESDGNDPYGDNDDDGIPNYLDKDDKGDGTPASCTDTTPVDGICDLGEALDPEFDTDQDGTPNHADEDSDNDGVPDSVENAEGTDPYDDEDFKDTDGDGIPDAIEPDADDDGIPNDDESDGIDPYGDNDDDAIPNYLDEDDKGDGTPAACTDTSPDDGICDAGQPLDPEFDTDQDGTPNHADEDSDDDGVPDSVEIAEGSDPYDDEDFKDSDGDGIPDEEEDDSDNDGIENIDESGGIDPYGDNDDDGIPNYLDEDDRGDGVASECTDENPDDGVCDVGEALDPIFDADGDGIPNHVEIDSDDDGIPDVVEGIDDEENDGTGDGAGNAYDTDSDNDGISDSEEAGVSGEDSDDDGIDDTYDVDETGGSDLNDDGIDDDLDEESEQLDTDEDGTPDYLDPDSDDDGIPDTIEGNGDNDGDDIPNYLDLDSDGDGIPDEVESGIDRNDDDGDDIDDAFDVDENIDNGTPGNDVDNNGVDDDIETLDTDGDGVPDYLDLDSDNDTIPDVIEAGLPDEDKDSQADDDDSTDDPLDTDNDGTPDYIDTDSNDDGIDDIDDAGNSDLDLDDDGKVDDDTDSDGDGIPDVVDDNDGFGTGGEDSDGDGIPDSVDPDDDNDGIADEYEGDGDSDGDGIPDYLDKDSDGDGVSDLEEVSKVPASGKDDDSDGIDDAFDVDFTGGPDADHDGIDDSLIQILDTDGDGIVNHLDTDSDNDGYSDFDENGDYNNDGIIDRLQKESYIETARQGVGSVSLSLAILMLFTMMFRFGIFMPNLSFVSSRIILSKKVN